LPTLTDLLNEERLRRHKSSAQEVANLLATAERDLADARLEPVSLDRRFMAAYSAALSLATIPLACAGYRSVGVGHHATVFEALPLVMGEETRPLSEYYDTCRIKRNQAEYRQVGVVTNSEVAGLITSVEEFMAQVREWLEANYPEFVER